MYNKKCKSTFLFVLSLVCLLTLIVPFMNVSFVGNANLALQIFYYIFIVIFCISLVSIIAVGIYSLFSNNFSLLSFQEALGYLAFIMVLINLIIFIPCTNCGLSVGYSILVLETFVMAFLSDIIKVIKKMPRIFRNLKQTLKEKQEAKQQLALLEHTEEGDNDKIQDEIEISQEVYNNNIDQVEIIPPDDELI